MFLFRSVFITATTVLMFVASQAPGARAVPFNVMHYMMNEDAPSSLVPSSSILSAAATSLTPVVDVIPSAIDIGPTPTAAIASPSISPPDVSAGADVDAAPDDGPPTPEPSTSPIAVVDASSNGARSMRAFNPQSILLGSVATMLYFVL